MPQDARPVMIRANRRLKAPAQPGDCHSNSDARRRIIPARAALITARRLARSINAHRCRCCSRPLAAPPARCATGQSFAASSRALKAPFFAPHCTDSKIKRHLSKPFKAQLLAEIFLFFFHGESDSSALYRVAFFVLFFCSRCAQRHETGKATEKALR